MYETPRCFKCGDLGHIKAECPKGTRSQASTPPAPADAVPARIRKTIDGDPVRGSAGMQPRRSDDQIADAHSWANRIRAADPRMGVPHCGESGDVISSPFRTAKGLGTAHECRLRILAASQAGERAEAEENLSERKAS